MSAATYSPSGALAYQRAEIVTCRWGGGAQAGKYHVFISGPTLTQGPRSVQTVMSMNCVVDDFGDLRRVQ